MTTAKPNVRYYVGRFKEGTRHRVIRRTKGKKAFFGQEYVEHAYERGLWKKTKLKFAQVSNLFATRHEARVEKRKADGRA